MLKLRPARKDATIQTPCNSRDSFSVKLKFICTNALTADRRKYEDTTVIYNLTHHGLPEKEDIADACKELERKVQHHTASSKNTKYPDDFVVTLAFKCKKPIHLNKNYTNTKVNYEMPYTGLPREKDIASACEGAAEAYRAKKAKHAERYCDDDGERCLIPKPKVRFNELYGAAAKNKQSLTAKWVNNVAMPPMQKEIMFAFRRGNEYAALSPEFLHEVRPIRYSDMKFLSVEHLFHALKFLKSGHTGIAEDIANCSTAAEARDKASDYTEFIRPLANPVLPLMTDAVSKLYLRRPKVKADRKLIDLLLSTGDLTLVYCSTGEDPEFWGKVNDAGLYKGQNHYGQILMKVRKKLRECYAASGQATYGDSNTDDEF